MSLNLEKSTWQTIRFGDVVNASKATVDPADGSVERYIAGEHMDTDDLEIHRWGEVGDGYLGPAFHRKFVAGQILYGSRRTYLRKVAVAEFDGVTANTTFVVEAADPTRLLQEFLPWVMSAEPFHAFAVQESKGSVNPYVNFSDLARYELTLPPLDEQRRLADLLWALEHHRRALVGVSQALATSRERNFNLALEAGLDEMGWKSMAIPDVVTAGPTNGKSATANNEERGLPTLSISAIRGGRVLGGDSVKYVDIARTEVEQFFLHDDDFLVVRGNGNKSLTGRGGLVNGGLPVDCFYPDLLIRLRFDPEVLRADFAAEQWNSSRAHGALVRKAKSTNGIWKINGKDIKSHSLVVPPLDAQNELLAQLAEYDSAATAFEREASTLAALRDRIMTEVFG
ncbi:restriction endonuclease subunit S [Leucobacter celer]|uniref:restriction endonuclease subunit S n=1 Tax=Leucobacter celer TaxID=668625 RepID=UPI0006A7DD6B|nr:restriction endonuclease subunit S [Leucobacter celer]